MSHPKTVKLFKPWAAAMVDGATVDKPNYGKTLKKAGKLSRMTSRRRKKRKKRKKRMVKNG